MNAMTLAQIVSARARETPDAAALHAGGKTVGYRALAEKAAHLANKLANTLAAEQLPAAPVVALAATADDLALATLACSWAGLPFLPLAADTTVARWQQLYALAPSRLYRLDRLPAASEKPMATAVPAQADTPALVIGTSGSEGSPKAVVLAHGALIAAAHASAAILPLPAGAVWLDCLPLHHIGGLSILWRCFAAGATVRLHDGFAAAAVWRDIASGDASHVSLVPAMLARLLDVADAPPPPTLRGVLIGGAALSRPLWERAVHAGWPLFISYGMSETAAQIATLPPTGTWHEGLVGHPLPGTKVAIDNDGRVHIRSPQLMLGYLDETDSAIDDGWLRSGDLGRLDADGRLTLLGRADDVFVSAGVNIHPQEVEAQLAACPGIRDVAVTATHDPVWGDALAALLVGSAEPDAVREWSRVHLPSALRPRRFQRVTALPRNAMGKLERRALPALLEKGTA